MKTKKDQKPVAGSVPPREGEDGRLYFNYNPGAEYEVSLRSGEIITYVIEDCCYRNKTEFYLISRSGCMLGEYSAARLNYLINFDVAIQTTEGEQAELPLTCDEVTKYYSATVYAKQRSAKDAVALLKKSKSYTAIKAEYIESQIQLTSAERKKEDVREEKERYDKAVAAFAKLCEDNSIDVKLFDVQEKCPQCAGKGILPNGEICACAYDIADKIKDYCAADRMRKRLSERC